VFVVCVSVRVGVWCTGVVSGWYGEYKAMAFERRWGTRRLRNVEEVVEAKENKEDETDEDEESESESEGDDDSDSAEETESDGEMDDEDEKEQRQEARKQRREVLTRRRHASAASNEKAAHSAHTDVSSAERMLYLTYSVGGISNEQQQRGNDEVKDER